MFFLWHAIVPLCFRFEVSLRFTHNTSSMKRYILSMFLFYNESHFAVPYITIMLPNLSFFMLFINKQHKKEY